MKTWGQLGSLLLAASIASSAAFAQPEAAAPPSPARLLFWLVAPLGLLFAARPAMHRLTDWLSERGDSTPAAAEARRQAQERALAPYRRRAQIELAQGQVDPDTWTQALQRAAGDELRARDRYVDLRAHWLRTAERERRGSGASRAPR